MQVLECGDSTNEGKQIKELWCTALLLWLESNLLMRPVYYALCSRKASR